MQLHQTTSKGCANLRCRYVGITGWRKPIGCLKLQVVFGKRAINSRAFLRKMTKKDKASSAALPPCRPDQSFTCVLVYLSATHAHPHTHIHTQALSITQLCHSACVFYTCVPWCICLQHTHTHTHTTHTQHTGTVRSHEDVTRNSHQKIP